jgi:octaprenyl-diphosphate synthase
MNLKIYSSKDFPSYLPKLNQLYDDLFQGGKKFRAKLVTEVGTALGLDSKTIHLLAQTIEFIHNASLLHDDLIDRSVLRRGKPAAWTKYGAEYSVLAGDYLLARVMVNLSSFGNIDLVHYTALVISDLLEGEWLQDSLVGDFQISLEDLDRVHNLKTSSLFKWCLRAPFIAAHQMDQLLHETLEEMGTLLGQLFQRSDDLLDFNVRNTEGKALLGDLKSGYLNSFAAFCLKDVSEEKRNKARHCHELSQFHDLVGGIQSFEELTHQFDQINSRLIALYEHHVTVLSHYLSKDLERNLVEFLRPITQRIYWRK